MSEIRTTSKVNNLVSNSVALRRGFWSNLRSVFSQVEVQPSTRPYGSNRIRKYDEFFRNLRSYKPKSPGFKIATNNWPVRPDPLERSAYETRTKWTQTIREKTRYLIALASFSCLVSYTTLACTKQTTGNNSYVFAAVIIAVSVLGAIKNHVKI